MLREWLCIAIYKVKMHVYGYIVIRGVYSGCARCAPHTHSQREKCMIVINKFNSKWETIFFLLFLALS